jgi:hypothetical protein
MAEEHTPFDPHRGSLGPSTGPTTDEATAAIVLLLEADAVASAV